MPFFAASPFSGFLAPPSIETPSSSASSSASSVFDDVERHLSSCSSSGSQSQSSPTSSPPMKLEAVEAKTPLVEQIRASIDSYEKLKATQATLITPKARTRPNLHDDEGYFSDCEQSKKGINRKTSLPRRLSRQGKVEVMASHLKSQAGLGLGFSLPSTFFDSSRSTILSPAALKPIVLDDQDMSPIVPLPSPLLSKSKGLSIRFMEPEKPVRERQARRKAFLSPPPNHISSPILSGKDFAEASPIPHSLPPKPVLGATSVDSEETISPMLGLPSPVIKAHGAMSYSSLHGVVDLANLANSSPNTEISFGSQSPTQSPKTNPYLSRPLANTSQSAGASPSSNQLTLGLDFPSQTTTASPRIRSAQPAGICDGSTRVLETPGDSYKNNEQKISETRESWTATASSAGDRDTSLRLIRRLPSGPPSNTRLSMRNSSAMPLRRRVFPVRPPPPTTPSPVENAVPRFITRLQHRRVNRFGPCITGRGLWTIMEAVSPIL